LHPEQASQYPHEFSGGQRQRIALAGALASHPRLIVLDEPVSALDVSIRAQMMNLLKDIQARENVAYLLVAHDLATVRYMADHVVVMYLGRIVESAPTRALFDEVAHPYTKALLSAVLPPRPDERQDEIVLAGEVPSPLAPPSGCRFHTRCPFATPRCTQEEPALREIAPAHQVACHLHDA
jgi:oligopeptide/dipeptide ABC transporter ATP-binding protein